VVTSSGVADYEGFKNTLKNASQAFHLIPKKEPIKIIGHLDADGLCSSAILINALMKLNKRYSLSIVPTLTDETLQNLKSESEKYFVFVDLGSGNIESIAKILDDKQVFILDHHMIKPGSAYGNIIQVNPHMHNIDGSNEISGAGVSFLFSHYLTDGRNTEMSRIAIVGAIGDIQENNGFKKLNDEILQIAVQNNLIEIRKGLKFFGIQTRPVHKILQYSSDILIPGVSGSESGAISFLTSIRIDPKLKNGWKKLADLTEDEKKRLVAAIIMKRDDKVGPAEIVSNIYLLVGEKEDSPFRDAKEFSTLLNSCGRLEKASIGIGACLNDPRMKELAVQNLSDYRKEIVNALNWYKDNKDSDKVIRSKKAIIINAEEEVLPTMIGTLGSILSKSPDIEKNTFILSLARNYDNTTKISLRVTGNPENVNLKEIIRQIIERISHGSSGGHTFAAGAVIDTDYEESFIKAAQEIFDNEILEEKLL
jgi:single-stranded-DNA-specific exonuclease